MRLPVVRVPLFCSLLLIASAFTVSHAAAQPTLSATFDADTIGPGSATWLRFAVDGAGAPASGVPFTAGLPAGVTNATPAAPTSSCADADHDAPEGGTTITMSGARIGAGASCSFEVLVTSSPVGAHVLTTSALSSSAGASLRLPREEGLLPLNRQRQRRSTSGPRRRD